MISIFYLLKLIQNHPYLLLSQRFSKHGQADHSSQMQGRGLKQLLLQIAPQKPLIKFRYLQEYLEDLSRYGVVSLKLSIY